MSIDTKRLSIGKLLGSVNEVFRIPLYQRPYNWGKDQWNDLWEDLIRLEGDSDETHFLGFIITISQERQKGFGYFEVVDGQQRITTLLILLIAIRDIAEEMDKDRAAYINNYFLKSSTIDEVEAKLILGRKDNKTLKKLVDQRVNKEELKDEKVIQAYYFFKEKLQESKLQWQSIYTKLLGSLDLVLMVTDSYYDAFRLFETLNNRGLSLSSVDLIKNYLLSKFASNESLIEECIEIWDSIIDNIEEIESVRLDKVRFFRHYLFSIEGVVPVPKLYAKYQNLIDTSDNLLSLVEDIWQKSELYLKLYNAMIGIKEVDERLKTLVRIEATTSYPLLLKCLSENLNKVQLITILDAIEVFTIRRSICNISTRDIDRIYNHLALESFTKENPVSYIAGFLKKRSPTDNEFYLNFQSRDFSRAPQTKYILEKIENVLTNNTKEKMINGQTDVHIEHILPRDIGLKGVLGYESSWQKELGSRASEYLMFVNRIGNLTLLGSELNITASNSPFVKKKMKYNQSNIFLTKELCQEEKWTFEEIKIRSTYLAGIAKKIWSFNILVLG
ncbi:DUF262 domain-containing protein [Peribacillus frigoritolerans]|uniref:DUF262 domain-containing protein n=1 Tax=Peribacillus frigoritolerans TaxID=450367 RepID=UPI00207A15E1|nr:DUF262 domain-containing protein [Peribacillus frigoritolerans]MEE3953438.1 DUF262 domain-containing HNH endonuclease family protein [Peribacillus frigoritolerans]USK63408.1 DUF262 domain-containing HNH endonuclease family protein [Peribacillus frigoritolerans]